MKIDFRNLGLSYCHPIIRDWFCGKLCVKKFAWFPKMCRPLVLDFVAPLVSPKGNQPYKEGTEGSFEGGIRGLKGVSSAPLGESF